MDELLGQQPAGPKLIVGDFNGELEDVSTLVSSLSSGQFLDIGVHPAATNTLGQNKWHTKNGGATRRDFMLGNPRVFRYIHKFEVVDVFDILTHILLRLGLKVPTQHEPINTALILPSLTRTSILRLGLA